MAPLHQRVSLVFVFLLCFSLVAAVGLDNPNLPIVKIYPGEFDNDTAFVNSTEWWITSIGALDNVDATQHNDVGGTLTIDETWFESLGDGFWLELDQGNWFNDSNGWINWDGNSPEFNATKLNNTIDEVSTNVSINFGKNESNHSQDIEFLLTEEGVLRMEVDALNSNVWQQENANVTLINGMQNVYIQENLSVFDLEVRSPGSICMLVGGMEACFSAINITINETGIPQSRIAMFLDSDFATQRAYVGTTFLSNFNLNLNASSNAITSANSGEGFGVGMIKWNRNYTNDNNISEPLLGVRYNNQGNTSFINVNDNSTVMRFGWANWTERDEFSIVQIVNETYVLNISIGTTNISNEVNIFNNLNVDDNITVDNMNVSGTINAQEISLANNGTLSDNSTCTFVFSPDGTAVIETCNGGASIFFKVSNQTKLRLRANSSLFTGQVDNLDDINNISRFTERNINDGNRSAAGYTAINDVNDSISFGIFGSNYANETAFNLSSVSGVFSHADADVVFVTAHHQGFKWYSNIEDDGFTISAVTNDTHIIMDLDKDGNLEVKGNVDVTNSSITNILSTVYNVSGCTDETAGTLCHDADFDTLRYVAESGQVYQINQETTMPAKNTEGSNVVDGSVVYIIGATGENPNFKLARADNLSTSGLMGGLTKNCVNNQVCPVVFFGMMHDIDTTAFSEGDHLYLSATESGNLTTTPPEFPNIPVWVATAVRIHATEGSMFVFPRLDSANGITMNDLGLVGDFIQTDYKIRSLEGHANLNGKNVMCIEMNGTTGENVCHVTFQPGGEGQASIWTRSGLVVPENLACLNNTNRTDAQCWADAGGFVWNITDFNTTNTEGADWGITGELEVIKSAFIGQNLTVANNIFTMFIGSITNRITKLWTVDIDASGNINQTNGNATLNRVYGQLGIGGNVTVSPDVLSVTVGTQDSGNITSVQSPDGEVLAISEVTGAPGFEVIFNFTGFSTEPRRVEFLGRYDGSPAHEVEIQLLNHSSGTYFDINSETGDIPSSDENLFLSFFISEDASSAITDGAVSLKIIHPSSGNPAHDFFIDFISITPSDVSLPNVGEFFQIQNYTNNNSNAVGVDNESGNMTIQVNGDYRVEVVASFAGVANSFLRCSVFKNGVEDINLRFLRKLNNAGDVANAKLAGVVNDLLKSDVLGVRCSSQIEDAFVTFSNLDFYIERISE